MQRLKDTPSIEHYRIVAERLEGLSSYITHNPIFQVVTDEYWGPDVRENMTNLGNQGRVQLAIEDMKVYVTNRMDVTYNQSFVRGKDSHESSPTLSYPSSPGRSAVAVRLPLDLDRHPTFQLSASGGLSRGPLRGATLCCRSEDTPLLSSASKQTISIVRPNSGISAQHSYT